MALSRPIQPWEWWIGKILEIRRSDDDSGVSASLGYWIGCYSYNLHFSFSFGFAFNVFGAQMRSRLLVLGSMRSPISK